MVLFLIFVAVPILEIALFIQVGGFLGLWPTLLIVILTALLGTLLVRAQGFRALEEIRQNISRFRDPTESLAHGAFILAAGLLLLTPGFFTDAVGFAFLVPQIRTVLMRYLRNRINLRVQTEFGNQAGSSQPNAPDGDVVDGEFHEIETGSPKPTHRPSSGWTQH